MQGFNFQFPAVRGVQAGREFYVAMCPLAVIPKVFAPDENSRRAHDRGQRLLTRGGCPNSLDFFWRIQATSRFPPLQHASTVRLILSRLGKVEIGSSDDSRCPCLRTYSSPMVSTAGEPSAKPSGKSLA